MAGRGYGAAVAIALTLTATPAFAQAPSDAEKAQVLAAVQALFDAMAKPDKAAIAAAWAPGAMVYSGRRGADGKTAMQATTAEAWTARFAGSETALVERIWNPVVLQRGDIAVVWAPFDAKRQGRLVNCGVDSFDLVRMDGAWKVAALSWTSEMEACAALGAPG